LDECNFLSKNRKLAPKWAGPYVITKVRDNGNIRIQLDKKEINVNRIKPFISTNPEQQPEPQNQTPATQTTADQADQKEEEQPWKKKPEKTSATRNSKKREGTA